MVTKTPASSPRTQTHAHDDGSTHIDAADDGHPHDGHPHDVTERDGHGHAHHHDDERGLLLALALTVVILLAETIGGLLSHSLALFADAGHVVTDLGGLGMALFAARQAHRPADHTRTFGYHRTGILVALLNASTLIVIALVIVVEAIGRLAHPQGVSETPMIAAAAVGLSLNLFIASRLHAHAGHEHAHDSHGHSHAHDQGHGQDLNIQGAWLHVIGDAGASAGVIVAAVVIGYTNWTPLDPILSVAIALLIAWGAWRLLGNALAILMEATPREINVPEMVRQMLRVPGVRDVHDLHVWSIGSGLTMMSCHVRIDDQPLCDGLRIVDHLDHMLADRFGISHSTIQPETTGCPTTSLYCALPCGCRGE